MIRFIALLCLVSSCSNSKDQKPTLDNSTINYPSNTLKITNNKAAFSIYEQLKNDSENLIFSPFSISSAMAGIYAGAKNKTEQEISTIFNFPKNTREFHANYGQFIQENTKGSKLVLANKLWTQKDLNIQKPFLDISKNYYHSEVESMSFSLNPEKSRESINQWVEDKTKHKITDLLARGTISSDTRLVLTNAIYFKDSWAIKFPVEKTKEATFFSTEKTQNKADFMNQTISNLDYFENEEYKAVKLAYTNEKQSMILVLPKDKNNFSLAQYNALSESFTKTKVQLSIPKFKKTTTLSLKEVLVKLGMSTSFSPQADLSKITGSKNLFLDNVYHKAFLEINEEGTEAAAATAVVGITRSVPRPTKIKQFIANKPFLFMLVNNSDNNIIFMGKITNPKG